MLPVMKSSLKYTMAAHAMAFASCGLVTAAILEVAGMAYLLSEEKDRVLLYAYAGVAFVAVSSHFIHAHFGRLTIIYYRPS